MKSYIYVEISWHQTRRINSRDIVKQFPAQQAPQSFHSVPLKISTTENVKNSIIRLRRWIRYKENRPEENWQFLHVPFGTLNIFHPLMTLETQKWAFGGEEGDAISERHPSKMFFFVGYEMVCRIFSLSFTQYLCHGKVSFTSRLLIKIFFRNSTIWTDLDTHNRVLCVENRWYLKSFFYRATISSV